METRNRPEEKFKTLTISDLRLIYDGLMDRHAEVIRRLPGGEADHKLLARQWKALKRLAPPTEGAVLGEELLAADAAHDGYGAATWFLTEAYLRAPSASPAVRAAAERVRAAFIEGLSELRRTYGDEADAARQRRPRLAELREDLEAFAVSGGREGSTLLTWVKAYLEAGDRIGELLEARSEALAGLGDEDRPEAREVRASALALLNHVRDGIPFALEADPKLPRNLDTVLSHTPTSSPRAASAEPAPAQAASKRSPKRRPRRPRSRPRTEQPRASRRTADVKAPPASRGASDRPQVEHKPVRSEEPR
jgi:hypothetical protein